MVNDARSIGFFDRLNHSPVPSYSLKTVKYKKGLIDGNYSYSTAVGLFNTVINVVLLLTVNKIVEWMNDGQGL